MKQTTGTGDPRESVEPLTARQREVLELIARGYTNLQIADALGVTIDGAKWHVREILSKLGVESREEAAEWWRHEHRAGTRLRRAIAGLSWLGALRWVAGGVAVVVLLLAGAALVAALSLRDDETPVAPDETATGEPTATAAFPTADTTVVASPSVPPGTFDPATAPELRFLDAAPLPPGSVIYYYGGNVPIEGQPQDLRRAYTGANGEVVVERMNAWFPLDWDVYDVVFDVDSAQIALALCSPSPCGNYRYVSPEEGAGWTIRLFESADGGVTWEAVGELPLNTRVVGYVDGDLVVTVTTAEGEQAPNRTWKPRTGDELAGPAGRHPFMVGKELGWLGQAPDLTDSAANVIYPPFPIPPSLEVSYFIRDIPVSTAIPAHGRADPGRTREWIVFEDGGYWTDTGSIEPSAQLDDDLFLVKGPGNLNPPGAVSRAMTLERATGVVRPVAGLIAPGTDEKASPITASLGPFARVDTPGSCLNVRAEASTAAQSLGCFADGVMLYDLDETVAAGGITWLRVETPDRREGWASLEFIERLR